MRPSSLQMRDGDVDAVGDAVDEEVAPGPVAGGQLVLLRARRGHERAEIEIARLQAAGADGGA